MRSLLPSIIAVLCLVSAACAQQPQYISPTPGSGGNPLSTVIIVRFGERIDGSCALRPSLFTVTGSLSGGHAGRIALSDDRLTLVFTPASAFLPDERVTVAFAGGVKLETGSMLPPADFRFSTRRESAGGSPDSQGSGFIQDTLPADFPQPITVTANNPAPGNIFIANISPLSISPTIRSYLMMFDSAGALRKYRKIAANPNYVALDFRMQPDGELTYFERGGGAPLHPVVRVLDTAWNNAREIRGVNLVNREQPDALLLPNGHVALVVWNNVTVDLSSVIPGGDPEATVWEVTIQELDSRNTVVFQWRSLEHFPPTDAYTDLKGVSVDYMHTNSLDVDRDGNFILSNRHFSEITKINRQTGEVMWRMGGKHNQFTFIGEHEENAPNYFSYQHHVAVLPNGNLTLFDNGTQHAPQYSRAVEYRIDEAHRTATLVWEYRHTPDIYAPANGSVQRLPDGGTFIGWGQVSKDGDPSITEVRPDGSIAFEMVLPKAQRSFKAFKLPWPACGAVADVGINEVHEGNTYDYNEPGNVTGMTVLFERMRGFLYNNLTVLRYPCPPVNPQFNGREPLVRPMRYVLLQGMIDTMRLRITVDLASVPEITDPAGISVYMREHEGQGTFEPVQTAYDSSANTLTFTVSNVGEFIFGSPDAALGPPPLPALVLPRDGELASQLLPVTLQWSPHGLAHATHLQVSRSDTFSDIVINDTLASTQLTTSAFVSAAGAPDQRYYWRVRTLNDAGASPWTDVWRFTTTAPFVTLSYPNGGESLQRNATCNIRFDRNIDGLVRLSLYRNGVFASTIRDSLANLQAFAWKIPAGTPVDSTYQVRIESVTDGTIADLSDNVFRITDQSTGVDAGISGRPGDVALSQNYPNPFSGSTRVEYRLPDGATASIIVRDIYGREVLRTATARSPRGVIDIDGERLPSPGTYFYTLSIDGRTITRMLTFIR